MNRGRLVIKLSDEIALFYQGGCAPSFYFLAVVFIKIRASLIKSTRQWLWLLCGIETVSFKKDAEIFSTVPSFLR